MPRTIDEGFRDFLADLTPSSTETEAAKTHRASIEECLKNNFTLRRFWRIGSFGNGTSISGYSDTDYMASMGDLTADSNYFLQKLKNALADRFPNESGRGKRGSGVGFLSSWVMEEGFGPSDSVRS